MLITAMSAGDTNPLSQYQWRNRLIIIVQGSDPDMARQQYQHFADDPEGVRDRDLLLLVIEEDRALMNGEHAPFEGSEITQAYRLDPAQFAVLLIGKDGGVKYRSTEEVTAADIYGLIDQMPMRRSEMRSRGN